MSDPAPLEGDVLLHCLTAGWIDERQAQAARDEAKRWHQAGNQVSMPTLLYGLGFLEQARAQALESTSPLPAPPEQIGPYAILERLGSGGMGDVYRAVDIEGRIVALKLLAEQYHLRVDASRRFRREARITRKLRHPHIVRTLDSGKDGVFRWLAMELVPGPTLKQRMDGRHCLSDEHGIVLLGQVATAMRAAGKFGILHRDIKPANIILAAPRAGWDEPFCAKLCDFGLANAGAIAVGDPNGSSALDITANGISLGTPHYMSPEQAQGHRDLDQRTDIYAMGAVLFHCLTGKTVHPGGDSQTIMTQQVLGGIDFRPLQYRHVSPALTTLLQSMLERDVAKRVQDWDSVLVQVHMLAPHLTVAIASDEATRNGSGLWSSVSRIMRWSVGAIIGFAALGSAIWWILCG